MNFFNGNTKEVDSNEFADYCLNLARNNPQLLESCFQSEVVEIILQAPKEIQQKLVQTQLKITAELAKETSQTSRMHCAFELMLEELYAEKGFFYALNLFGEMREEFINRQVYLEQVGTQLAEFKVIQGEFMAVVKEFKHLKSPQLLLENKS